MYACVADIGWITGHSYILYGPLVRAFHRKLYVCHFDMCTRLTRPFQLNGATTVMFESVPTFPDAGRYWDLVARHKINLFYTAPTAIRTLMSFGVRSLLYARYCMLHRTQRSRVAFQATILLISFSKGFSREEARPLLSARAWLCRRAHQS